MTPPTSSLGSPAGNTPEFRQAFIRKCHRLVGLAYQTLDAPSFHGAEETEITGELVHAMEELLEKPSAPRWMHQMDVLDDPPQNTPGRRGRRRRRVDIEIRRVQAGPRPRFRFEAKRLNSKQSIAAYLGRDGLMLYVTGEYAREQDEAGMLGYIQTETPAEWAGRIGGQLHGSATSYSVCMAGEWVSSPLVEELGHTFRSGHDRSAVGRSIAVYHTLLIFHSGRTREAAILPNRSVTPGTDCEP